MAKNQNTFAKRQREMAKKDKASRKREQRNLQRKKGGNMCEQKVSRRSLSPAELSVLDRFNTYLMTPEKMLCFGKQDLEIFEIPLASLTSDGLLVAEKFQGGYSLTENGFAVMNESRQDG